MNRPITQGTKGHTLEFNTTCDNSYIHSTYLAWIKCLSTFCFDRSGLFGEVKLVSAGASFLSAQAVCVVLPGGTLSERLNVGRTSNPV